MDTNNPEIARLLMEETETENVLTERPAEGPKAGRLIVDVRPVKLTLAESSDGTGKVVVRGEFARCDVATENGRVYPKKLWEREFKRLGKNMTERLVFGELDHPSDGRTSLKRVSHIVTNLHIEDGIVIGEAEVLDTECGRNLKALLKSGCKVGVSSRGYGSTRSTDEGKEMVQEDYRLVTFDFVAEPADSNAYPDVFLESKNKEVEAEPVKVEAAPETPAVSEEDTKLEAARAEARESVREEFQRDLLGAVAKAKAEMEESVRKALLADPAVAGAKTALEGIISMLRPYGLSEEATAIVKSKDEEIARLTSELAESNSKIDSLNEDLTKLTRVAREAGYRYFVEKAISGNPDATLVRKLIGDVSAYSDINALKSKLESITSELDNKRIELAKAEEQKLAEKKAAEERLTQENKALKKRAKTLEEALEKTAETQKKLALKLYAEKKLVGNPKADKLRPMMESVNVDSKEDVDNLIKRFDLPDNAPEVTESVRARVRGMTRGGVTTTARDEERSVVTESKDFNGIGMDVDYLRRLSGIDKK